MKHLISILFLVAVNTVAETPTDLICKSYGSAEFFPDQEAGNKIDVLEEKDNWASEESTINIDFEKGQVSYISEKKNIVESLRA